MSLIIINMTKTIQRLYFLKISQLGLREGPGFRLGDI